MTDAHRDHAPADDGYELLDAGDGRRLERFGARVVDRPSAAATGPRLMPAAWESADLVFERPSSLDEPADASAPASGWQARSGRPEPWQATFEGLTLELRPTPTGQVGLFPEHLAQLAWLEARLSALTARLPVHRAGAPPTVLNLFAFTGAVTLASARAGSSVVHVDASRPAVTWARRNATLSSLAEAPVRWIVDDVPAFVAREGRRGRIYQGIILDPPSYGHGLHGREWRLERDLPDLLAGCAAILDAHRSFVLLTAHTPGFGPVELAAMLGRAVGRQSESGWLEVSGAHGAHLRLGAYARTVRGPEGAA